MRTFVLEFSALIACAVPSVAAYEFVRKGGAAVAFPYLACQQNSTRILAQKAHVVDLHCSSVVFFHCENGKS